MAGSDFCMVQLTAAGIALADGGSLRVTGRTSLVFTAGQPTRVANYEWDGMLKCYPTTDGTSLFELVPAAVAADTATAPAATAKTAKATAAATAPTTPATTSDTTKESN